MSTPLLCLLLALAPVSQENSAPSSHLVYNDASFAGDLLINEVRVPAAGEALYTYYEGLGWSGTAAGYAGIQAHPQGHNYIFSIWDHKAHTAPITAVYVGAGTRTEKFGGEGTGLKSWNFELGWETDVWYTLVARCWPVGDHTFYGYWVRSDKTQHWTHLVTMDVAAPEAYFQGGNDSFLEDWSDTGNVSRTIHLRNGWKRRPSGQWHAFAQAQYSVNAWDLAAGKRSFQHRTHWNGGVARDSSGEFYFMTAGGLNTQPTTTNPANFEIARSESQPNFPAIQLANCRMERVADGRIRVTWEIEPTALPQFSYQLEIFAGDNAQAEPLFVLEKTEPHARSAEFALPDKLDPRRWRCVLRCRDILDHDSAAVELSGADLAPR